MEHHEDCICSQCTKEKEPVLAAESYRTKTGTMKASSVEWTGYAWKVHAVFLPDSSKYGSFATVLPLAVWDKGVKVFDCR